MKLTNKKLQDLIIGLTELSQLRTGPKIAYNIAHTLRDAGATWDVVELVRGQLNKRFESEPEAVTAEWQDIMALEVEINALPVSYENLEACIDADKITAVLLLQLDAFIY